MAEPPYYFLVDGVDLANIMEPTGVAYTEQATRGYAYGRHDGQFVTGAFALSPAQRLLTGRLFVATDDTTGPLPTADLLALKLKLEAATTAVPVRIQTNMTPAVLDGFFVLDPGSSVGHTPALTDGTYHAWSATLRRIS